ncbi:YciI family protein [Agromyces sp. NPDC056523]|uniref:YciI family protein n=1 Tax=Agromyces sp. NPDC056523 TaxID=3345850 RepID=UPI00366F7230
MMTKYLVLYHADVGAEEQMQQSEADAQAGMQVWMDWAQGAGAALLDFGTPVGNARRVDADGADAATTTVGGYSLVEAADADAAAALMKGHPHLRIGTIEVLESIDLPGM